MDVHPEHADVSKLRAQVVGAVNIHHPVPRLSGHGGARSTKTCVLLQRLLVAIDHPRPGQDKSHSCLITSN